jgi:hypothetical protein
MWVNFKQFGMKQKRLHEHELQQRGHKARTEASDQRADGNFLKHQLSGRGSRLCDARHVRRHAMWRLAHGLQQ